MTEAVEPSELHEHPGTGVEMHGIELPADGTEHELSAAAAAEEEDEGEHAPEADEG